MIFTLCGTQFFVVKIFLSYVDQHFGGGSYVIFIFAVNDLFIVFEVGVVRVEYKASRNYQVEDWEN